MMTPEAHFSGTPHEKLSDQVIVFHKELDRLAKESKGSSLGYLIMLAAIVVGIERVQQLGSKEELLMEASKGIEEIPPLTDFLSEKGASEDLELLLIDGVSDNPLLQLKKTLKHRVSENETFSSLASLLITNS